MSLKLNADDARKADKQSSIIRETGQYIGTITRAEKLLSKKKTQGVGFSFKDEHGNTANYLDVYTVKADGKLLWGMNLVNAVLCCTRTNDAAEGEISFKKWDKEVNEMVDAKAIGYPSLMDKKIGFVLQRELGTNPETGTDTDKVVLVRVFEAATGLTSTEILDGKTKGEKLPEFMKTLAPIRDNRKKVDKPSVINPAASSASSAFDDDIPF